ncbi:hypothetical protein S40288_03395 [Stachybotrys chartarum IBT 40288]|nr:hypothetical protein S40288_03395 [Stachybotrys chartarum IBT 40288]
MSQTQKRVLIVGGGVAGPVLAYWLGKNNYSVVVLERSKEQTELGQVIDIEGPSQEIVSRMGLLDAIRDASTHEEGITIVDEHGRGIATLPAGQAGGATKEIEIMRPRLHRLLLGAVKGLGNVEYRFGHTVAGLEKLDGYVRVEVLDIAMGATKKEDYEIVVACDGFRSRTRDLILPDSKSQACIKSLEVFFAFFEVPTEPQDRPYSRLYNQPGRRVAAIKPIDDTISSAYIGVAKFDQELHDVRESRDVQKQKEAMARRFRGTGWETDRLVDAMFKTENFYFEEISQIKVDTWSDGRCVLLGDTAWCPSPLTGQGTNTAILGAYVLADSIIKNGNDVDKAFREYESDMRPYVNKIQPIPLGGYAPKLVNPDSAWGIWVQRSLFWCISNSGLSKYLPDNVVKYEKLPDLY